MVKLVDPTRVAEGLERMNEDPTAQLTGQLAMELAEREGIKAVLDGEIGAIGQGFVISLRLLYRRDLPATSRPDGADARPWDGFTSPKATIRRR